MNNETKWTPGEWSSEPAQVGHQLLPVKFNIRIFSKDPGPEFDYTIALVRDFDAVTREANAHLIAAAPALYKVLAAITEDYLHLAVDDDGNIDRTRRNRHKAAMAALKAARGEK